MMGQSVLLDLEDGKPDNNSNDDDEGGEVMTKTVYDDNDYDV